MKRIILMLCIAMISCSAGAALYAQDHTQTAQNSADSIKAVAAGIAVGLSCIAGGIAVGRIGAAAMGAMSENPDLFGKALPLVGLAEGICLWGFLVALLILFL